MKTYMVCLATALVGAYALVRVLLLLTKGVSIFSGGYPDETYVMRLINSKEYQQFARIYGAQIYGYLLAIVLLTAAGMWFQSYFVPEKVETQGEKKVIKKDDFIKLGNNSDQPEQKNAVSEVKDDQHGGVFNY